MSIWK